MSSHLQEDIMDKLEDLEKRLLQADHDYQDCTDTIRWLDNCVVLAKKKENSTFYSILSILAVLLVDLSSSIYTVPLFLFLNSICIISASFHIKKAITIGKQMREKYSDSYFLSSKELFDQINVLKENQNKYGAICCELTNQYNQLSSLFDKEESFLNIEKDNSISCQLDNYASNISLDFSEEQPNKVKQLTLKK